MNPRLEQIDRLGPITVWSVDGDKVRAELDPDFTNFGQHYRFNFIPDNEFWLDREASPGEQQFFIDHLKVEHRLMSQGASYDDALAAAARVEKAERAKSARVRSRTDAPDQSEVKLQLLAEDGDVQVWLVDGELVRDYFDVDFTEGGHGYIYDWIPFDEVWIDDDVSEHERQFVLLHEARERILMKQGMPYDQAHSEALKAEMAARSQSAEALVTSILTRARDVTELVDELVRSTDELTTTGGIATLPMPMVVKDRDDATTKPGYPFVKTTRKDDGKSGTGVKEDMDALLIAAMDELLHPNGRCTCYGEGRCEWCKLHEYIQGSGYGGGGSQSDYHTGPWTFGIGGPDRGGHFKDLRAATRHGQDSPDQEPGAVPPPDWPDQWTKGTKKLNIAYNKEESMMGARRLIDRYLEGKSFDELMDEASRGDKLSIGDKVKVILSGETGIVKDVKGNYAWVLIGKTAWRYDMSSLQRIK